MLVPSNPASWWGSLIWLVGTTVAAFLIAWLSGTRLHIRRPVYIPLLLAMTLGLAAGYIAWLGVGFAEVMTNHWAWGLLGAAVAGVPLAFAMTSQPVDHEVHGRQLTRALVWEGVVYGTAEGILLSALPPFMTWQMVHSLGWTGPWGAVARWALPLLAAAAVIVIHHLGYWSFRNRILVPVTLGLSALTAAFLLTASWIAPTLGHILAHFGAVLHGTEMPPHERPGDASGAEVVELRRAA